MTAGDFSRWIKPIKKKIINIITRGILSSVDNTKKTQLIQSKGLGGGLDSNVERFQQYGLETYPYADQNSETINLHIGGIKERAINIVVHNRELRPTDLTEGQVCLYSKDSAGSNTNRITIKPDDSIEIKTKDNNIITINPNGIIIEDKNGNKVTMDSSNLKLENTTCNITIGAASVTINGTGLEVLV